MSFVSETVELKINVKNWGHHISIPRDIPYQNFQRPPGMCTRAYRALELISQTALRLSTVEVTDFPRRAHARTRSRP